MYAWVIKKKEEVKCVKVIYIYIYIYRKYDEARTKKKNEDIPCTYKIIVSVFIFLC